MQKIIPHLWFNNEAEEAANYYTTIFKNSKMGKISHFPKAGFETHQRPAGSVMTVEFELNGQTFLALNGGPHFTFNEAVSFVVPCDTQEEIDYFWEKLKQGGDEKSQQCGWLKDKYGVSWQIVPSVLKDLITEPEKSERVMSALLQMKKLDIAKLKAA